MAQIRTQHFRQLNGDEYKIITLNSMSTIAGAWGAVARGDSRIGKIEYESINEVWEWLKQWWTGKPSEKLQRLKELKAEMGIE